MLIWLGDAACELGAEYLIEEATAGLAQHHHVFYGRYVASAGRIHDADIPQVSCVDMDCAHKLWMVVDMQAVMDQIEFQLSTCSSSTLAGVCVVSDLDDGVSCAASAALLQELSWRVPELSRTAVGLVPLGGLQGMANYHAVLSMDASLRLADRFLVRSPEDAMKLRDVDLTDVRPFCVGGLWRYVAADLLVGAVNGFCSAAQTADDPASATGDWTDRTVSHACSVMDLRSNMWRRLSLANNNNNNNNNSSSSSSSSSNYYYTSSSARGTLTGPRSVSANDDVHHVDAWVQAVMIGSALESAPHVSGSEGTADPHLASATEKIHDTNVKDFSKNSDSPGSDGTHESACNTNLASLSMTDCSIDVTWVAEPDGGAGGALVQSRDEDPLADMLLSE